MTQINQSLSRTLSPGPGDGHSRCFDQNQRALAVACPFWKQKISAKADLAKAGAHFDKLIHAIIHAIDTNVHILESGGTP